MIRTADKYKRRQSRNRHKIALRAAGKPRLSVHRTNTNIYAQIIDDSKRATLAAAGTLEKDVQKTIKLGSNKAAAEAIGKLIAERAQKAGVTTVVFDRGAYLYHGRVKALADAARAAGLQF